MYIIKRESLDTPNWDVGYLETFRDEQVFNVTVTCSSMLDAAEICSWLNGGRMPMIPTLKKAGFAS